MSGMKMLGVLVVLLAALALAEGASPTVLTQAMVENATGLLNITGDALVFDFSAELDLTTSLLVSGSLTVRTGWRVASAVTVGGVLRLDSFSETRFVSSAPPMQLGQLVGAGGAFAVVATTRPTTNPVSYHVATAAAPLADFFSSVAVQRNFSETCVRFAASGTLTKVSETVTVSSTFQEENCPLSPGALGAIIFFSIFGAAAIVATVFIVLHCRKVRAEVAAETAERNRKQSSAPL